MTNWSKLWKGACLDWYRRCGAMVIVVRSKDVTIRDLERQLVMDADLVGAYRDALRQALARAEQAEGEAARYREALKLIAWPAAHDSPERHLAREALREPKEVRQ